MNMMKQLVLLGLGLTLSSPAAALPPPVPVRVTILSVDQSAETFETAERLIAALVADNYISGPAASRAGDRFNACLPMEGTAQRRCLSAARDPAEGPNAVLMVLEHPRWRGAQLRMTCFGPDLAKAKVSAIHLRDTFHIRADIANGERRRAASCLIGALHGPVS